MVNDTTMSKGTLSRPATKGAIDPADVRFIATLTASGCSSAAGRKLVLSTAASSQRPTQTDARAGVDLVQRTMRLTKVA